MLCFYLPCIILLIPFFSQTSENELEELLTTYTKQNKSASIFLGTSTPQPKSLSEMMAQPTSVNSGTGHQHNHHHHHHHHHNGQQHTKHASTGGGALLNRRTSSAENLHSVKAGGAGASGDTSKEISKS